MGTPLLGAVVLPRLGNPRGAEPSGPAVALPAMAKQSKPVRLDGPVADSDLTQPMRFPTNTMSAAEKAKAAALAAEKTAEKPHVRPRTADAADEVTAVIDMSGMVKDGDGK